MAPISCGATSVLLISSDDSNQPPSPARKTLCSANQVINSRLNLDGNNQSQSGGDDNLHSAFVWGKHFHSRHNDNGDEHAYPARPPFCTNRQSDESKNQKSTDGLDSISGTKHGSKDRRDRTEGHQEKNHENQHIGYLQNYFFYVNARSGIQGPLIENL